MIAFVVAVVSGPRMLSYLRVLKFGQNINTDAPSSHAQKQGTPTMGGVLIVLGVTVSLVITTLSGAERHVSAPLVAVWLVFVGHAILGFLDDYLKIKRGRSLGLLARQKLAGQVIIAGGFVLWLHATAQPDFTTVLTFGRGASVDAGVFYYVLAALLMMGMSNAVNLSDGLDGLAGGLACFCAIGLAATVYALGPNFAQLPLFGYAIVGASLGFLWFNAHPARVFMGDTGSLALGAGFAAMAIAGKQEVLLLVFALVFIVELASVIIQVTVFKATGGKTGGGRRVFRMTPIHHHFELGGLAETQVVARFCLVGALCLVLGLLLAPHLSPFGR